MAITNVVESLVWKFPMSTHSLCDVVNVLMRMAGVWQDSNHCIVWLCLVYENVAYSADVARI